MIPYLVISLETPSGHITASSGSSVVLRGQQSCSAFRVNPLRYARLHDTTRANTVHMLRSMCRIASCRAATFVNVGKGAVHPQPQT